MQDKNMPDEQEENNPIENLSGADLSTLTLRDYYDLFQKILEKEAGKHATVGDYIRLSAVIGHALYNSSSSPLLKPTMLMMIIHSMHGYNAYRIALGKKSIVDRCLTSYLQGKGKSFLKQFKGIVNDENQEGVIRELIGLDLDQRQEGIDEKLEKGYQPLLERVGVQYVEETE